MREDLPRKGSLLNRHKGTWNGSGYPIRLISIAALLFVAGSLWLLPSEAMAGCPNESFRVGASASLPDCRAYELVTPADSNGRVFAALKTASPANMFRTPLLSPFRDSVIFMADGTPLAEPGEANGTLDLYDAIRTTSGWRTVRRLSPSGAQAMLPNAGGVSSDHQYAFTEASKPDPSRPAGSLTDNESEGGTYVVKPDGSIEPVGLGSQGEEPFAQGRYIAPGGSHIIFSTGGLWCLACPIKQLEPEAAPSGTPAIYDRSADGPTRVVSLLPGNKPLEEGEAAEFEGVSDDGSVVAFAVDGALYVRINDEVTKEVTSNFAAFGGLANEGEDVFYVSAGNIYRFSIDTGVTQQVNEPPGGAVLAESELVNVSADGSHVYFLSPSALSGADAAPGVPNLYVWGDDTIKFVATVSPADLASFPKQTEAGDVLPALNRWAWSVSPLSGHGPGGESSRTTPTGRVLLFESRAQLTDYPTGGHNEVYRYDNLTGALTCISCNSSVGSPPTHDARLEALHQLLDVLGGAYLLIPNLTVDGERAFFETPEALVPQDLDGVNDIYEWRQGEGVSLISSGQSAFYTSDFIRLSRNPAVFWEPNIIFGISPDGENIVFRATDQLVPQAGVLGTPALYDARVNGGFPAPPPVSPCEGDSCQRAPSQALPLGPPRSDRFHGKGNVKVRCKRRHRVNVGRKQPQRARRKLCHGHKRRKHREAAK